MRYCWLRNFQHFLLTSVPLLLTLGSLHKRQPPPESRDIGKELTVLFKVKIEKKRFISSNHEIIIELLIKTRISQMQNCLKQALNNDSEPWILKNTPYANGMYSYHTTCFDVGLLLRCLRFFVAGETSSRLSYQICSFYIIRSFNKIIAKPLIPNMIGIVLCS